MRKRCPYLESQRHDTGRNDLHSDLAESVREQTTGRQVLGGLRPPKDTFVIDGGVVCGSVPLHLFKVAGAPAFPNGMLGFDDTQLASSSK